MKNWFKSYVAYIQDNPNHYWFKRKLYGWGWTPATWQGWLLTLFFIAVIVGNAVRLDVNDASTNGDVFNFIVQTFGMTILFIIIAWKTGERPKWMWGIPKKNREEKGDSI